MEPEGKFCAGLFKDGASAGVNMASLFAGICPAAFNLRHLGNDTTRRASIGLAVFPFEDRHQASVIGRVLGLELLESVLFGGHVLPLMQACLFKQCLQFAKS
jgi:hypothetical protein